MLPPGGVVRYNRVTSPPPPNPHAVPVSPERNPDGPPEPPLLLAAEGACRRRPGAGGAGRRGRRSGGEAGRRRSEGIHPGRQAVPPEVLPGLSLDEAQKR